MTQRALHGVLARMLDLAQQGARQKAIACQQVAQVQPELHALPLAQLPRSLRPKPKKINKEPSRTGRAYSYGRALHDCRIVSAWHCTALRKAQTFMFAWLLLNHMGDVMRSPACAHWQGLGHGC